jgi:malto-oligosyltrehalose trehalohydrolase
MHDDSALHIVREIAQAIASGPGRTRHVHLVVENEHNGAGFLDASRGEPYATAQWADDFHHAVHVLATGERDGYYADFAERPAWQLARSLAEGFAYQGERSTLRKGAPRGEPSAHLPFGAFMLFLQNHDQIGNRAMGERLTVLAPEPALRLAVATLLLAPQVPLLFMGEEFASLTPFLYFCDFHGGLADAVREGRRREFAAFERFASDEARRSIPDPNAEETFERSKLRWKDLEAPGHAAWLAFYRALLALRREHVRPRIARRHRSAAFEARDDAVMVDWTFGDGSALHLRANFSALSAPGLARAPGTLLHAQGDCGASGFAPWSGAWTLETP